MYTGLRMIQTSACAHIGYLRTCACTTLHKEAKVSKCLSHEFIGTRVRCLGGRLLAMT